jgi:hypothetical protein
MLPRAPDTAAPLSPSEGGAEMNRDSLAGWLGGIETGFEAAASRAGVIEQQLRLAGTIVRLRLAGPVLNEQLGPALAHAADDSDEPPVLTISAWDSETSGVEPPPLPSTDGSEPRGAVFYSAVDAHQVAYQPGLSQLSAFNAARGKAWFWCRSAADLPFWEPAAPFRQILHWWLADRGLMMLHGASVGTREGGVLLVGRGGSGKSSCALASLASDLLYAGDDYVALGTDPEPWVYSLYCSGKLAPGHAKRFSHLPPASFDGDGSEEEKAVFYVNERFPGRMCEGFPLKAVLVPKIAGDRPRIFPVDPSEALRALAPSTLLQLHPARPQALTGMARLVRRVPTYAFELGPDIELIPDAIESFLGGLAG